MSLEFGGIFLNYTETVEVVYYRTDLQAGELRKQLKIRWKLIDMIHVGVSIPLPHTYTRRAGS